MRIISILFFVTFVTQKNSSNKIATKNKKKKENLVKDVFLSN